MDNKSLIPITKELLDDIERKFGKLERNKVYNNYCEWRKKSRITDKRNDRSVRNKIGVFHKKKNNLCVDCGIKLEKNYKQVRCKNCKVKHNKIVIKCDKKRRENRAYLKKQGRKCLWCGNPIPLKRTLGTKYCKNNCKHKHYYQKRKGEK